jgi:Trk K+ transport system NAD-binding subunit
LEKLGFPVVQGDPENTQVLEQAGLPQARALIAITNASQAVVRVCCLAQERYGVPVVIARAEEPALVQELKSSGVRVVQPTMATALALEGALHFPTAFSMLAEQSDDVEFLDVPLRNHTLAGRPLRQVRLPGNALVMGIQRQGEIVIPHGDSVLLLEDVLLLVGSPNALADSMNLLNGGYAQ